MLTPSRLGPIGDAQGFKRPQLRISLRTLMQRVDLVVLAPTLGLAHSRGELSRLLAPGIALRALERAPHASRRKRQLVARILIVLATLGLCNVELAR